MNDVSRLSAMQKRLARCKKRFTIARKALLENDAKTEVDWYILACCLRISAAVRSAETLRKKTLMHDTTASVRAIFETLVMMAGAAKIPDFSKRLHASFVEQQLGLIRILWETGAYRQFETLQQLKWRNLAAKTELDKCVEAGFKPFGNNAIHEVARVTGMEKLKFQYYKLLSLGAHPTVHAIEKYVRAAEGIEQFKVNEYPDAGETSQESIMETLGNFLNLASALLNDRYLMGLKIWSFEDMVKNNQERP